MSQTLIFYEITGLTGSYLENKYGKYILMSGSVVRFTTVSTFVLDYLARRCAGPTQYLADFSHMYNLLRETSLLGEEETVIPFSLVSNGCVVPYPDDLVTINLQIINKDGEPLDEYITIYETFHVTREKHKPF